MEPRGWPAKWRRHRRIETQNGDSVAILQFWPGPLSGITATGHVDYPHAARRASWRLRPSAQLPRCSRGASGRCARASPPWISCAAVSWAPSARDSQGRVLGSRPRDAVNCRVMGTSRNTLEEVLEQARRLPEEDRKQLVADLQADQSAPPSEGRRQTAMKRWLARAGTGHADVNDVSSRKNDYLAEASATRP